MRGLHLRHVNDTWWIYYYDTRWRYAGRSSRGARRALSGYRREIARGLEVA